MAWQPPARTSALDITCTCRYRRPRTSRPPLAADPPQPLVRVPPLARQVTVKCQDGAQNRDGRDMTHCSQMSWWLRVRPISRSGTLDLRLFGLTWIRLGLDILVLWNPVRWRKVKQEHDNTASTKVNRKETEDRRVKNDRSCHNFILFGRIPEDA